VIGDQLDPSSATLTPVLGSPFVSKSAGGMGALAAYNGNLYIAHYTSLAGQTQLVQFKVDPLTGSVSQAATFDAGVPADGDNMIRRLYVNSAHKVLYAQFQWTVNSFSLAADGTPKLLNSVQPSTGSVWGFDFMPNGPYAYAAIQNGNPKVRFQAPQIVLLNVNPDGSLTVNRTLLTLNNSSGLAGDLRIDPSGKFVVVTNGQNNEQISVFAIQGDGSLKEVSGSPFQTGSQMAVQMAFDSTGQFLYLFNNVEYVPQTETLQTFALNSSTGELTPVQTLDLPDMMRSAWLQVDGNFVYVANDVSSGLGATITIYNRDAKTGELTQASTTNLADSIGEIDTLHY